MNVITASCTGPVLLGRQGENGVTTVRFPVRGWPGGEEGERQFSLLHQRSQDDAAYPCQITADGTYVYWTVTSADTQYDGRGQAELRCAVGDSLAKSEIFSTVVAPSLDADTEAPEPWQSWVDGVLAATAHYPKLSEDGTWLVWDPSAGTWADTGAAASSGGSGDHALLTNRTAANQHPMSAITGLAAALAAKGTYSKPTGGIPGSDLTSAVQASLSKADAALQSVPATYRTAAAQDTVDALKQPKAITDAGGYFTTDTVEGALQEVGAELSGINTLLGSGVIV